MRVNPISEADAMPPGVWKRGLYDFEIIDAAEQTSKAGNDMIKLTAKLYDTEGKSRTIYDYLVSSEGMAYKVRHFASATGLLPAYEKGELRAVDCIGKTGRCQLGIEKKDGYEDKNNVQDYVKSGTGPLVTSKAPEDLDDEIPF